MSLLKTLLFAFALISSYAICHYGVLKLTNKSVDRFLYFPGPVTEPFLGHARAMPKAYAWKTFTKWGRAFGDIIYLYVLGRSILVLNSEDSARELLEKRSSNNSDRPRFVLLQEIMGWDNMLVFLRYGDTFRSQRRLLQQYWSAQNIAYARPTQRIETHKLLVKLLQTQEDYAKHIERVFSSSILMTTYGHQVVSDDDKFVHIVELATKLTAESGNPGSTPVDIFPFLKYIPTWFPGAGFKRKALETRQVIREMLDKPYEFVQRERVNGTARPSFVSKLLDDYEQEGVSDASREENIKAVAGVLYGAGVETTTSSLLLFVFAMLSYPTIAKKAQEEIDRVVGADRLPDFQDRGNLPYLEGVLRETYRLNPPLPLGVPHCSMKEDTYKGKQIPEETMILSNIWGMMRDPTAFPDPDEFKPERHLDEGKKSIRAEDSTSLAVFGFGRRICPGRFYADAGTWITMACILACFDILPYLDEHGKEIVPGNEFTDGFVSKPMPFKCRFVLRKPSYKALIRQTQVEAE